MSGQPSRRALLRGGVGAVVLGAAAAACGGSASTPARSGTAGSPASSAGPAGLPAGAGGGSATALPAFVERGPTAVPSVALTFHGAGDPALADALLSEAERAGATVTVFAVCQWLDQHPDLAARITRGGHELANHTYTHPSLARLSRSAVDTEIVRAREVLTRLTGGPTRWFRPSAMERPTPVVAAAAAAAGYATVVGYDVDPRDYTDPGATAVRERTLAALHPGAVVSLHLGHPGTVTALPAVLDALRSRGLAPVTVSRLLGA